MLPIIETLAQRTVKEMAERAQDWSVRMRQIEAERRLLILQGQWKELARAHVNGLYKDADVKREVAKRVKTTTNVLGMLCDRVCVAYKVPPVRRLEGSSQRVSKAWAQVMAEAKIASRSKQWERWTFGMNVIVVIPVVRGTRLDYMPVLPHCSEVITHPGDPMGDPQAMVIEMQSTSDRPDRRFTYAIVDDQEWRFLDEKGGQVAPSVRHGAGVFPGVAFRLSEPVDDWYDSHRGDGLVEATLEVAHLQARMDWVRFHQDRAKEFFFAEALDKVPIQVVGAEYPVELGVRPSEAEWKVAQVNTAIDNHRAHIRYYIERSAESVGVPMELVDFEAGSGNAGNSSPLGHARQHAALDDVRRNHEGFLGESESQLAWKTSLVLRGMGHPMASQLQPDEVKARFEVEFAPPTFVEHPKTQLEVWKAEVNQGLASTYEIFRRKHPHLSHEEAVKRVNDIAAQEAQLDAVYIEHGLPRDSELRGASREKILGTIGGMRSGESRSPEQLEQDPTP